MTEVIVISPITVEDNQKKRVCAYARVSSDLEDQQNSFAAQVDYYTTLIGENQDFEFIDIYADEGITGTSVDKRDDFLRMMKDCRKEKIDRILTKSVSRFARNVTDCLEHIRELRSLGVTVKFEKENIDTASMTDEMLLTIMSSIAQEESMSISSNMRWYYKHRMESGRFITCSRPYGYRLENGALIIDDAESEIVRHIFHSYLSGKGTLEIAKELSQRCIPKKDGKTTWYHTTVDQILKSEKYIGDALLQKSYTTDTLPFKKMRNNGQKDQYYIKNSHSPIISKEDFERVKALFEIRGSKYASKQLAQQYPFSRKIECGECGSTFKRTVGNEKIYWVCYNHFRDSKNCTVKQVPESELHTAFVRMYNKLKQNSDSILLPILKGLQEFQNKSNKSNIKIMEINKEIAELANQNLVLKDITSKGYLDSDIFMQQSNEINSKIAKLRRAKQMLMNVDEDDDTIQNTQTIINIVETGQEIIQFNPDTFDSIVDKIIVESQEQIKFKLINGLQLSEKISKIVR